MENVFEEVKRKYGIKKFYAGLSGGKDSISCADCSIGDELKMLGHNCKAEKHTKCKWLLCVCKCHGKRGVGKI